MPDGQTTEISLDCVEFTGAIDSIGRTFTGVIDLDATELRPGDEHYMAYVGPPTLYDVMGATQFRLLTTLGLRSHNRLLDFGCGSLRAGRLFISYLDESRYFGIDPNKWLIDDAIANQLGEEMIRLKRPSFDHNQSFTVDAFGETFDYIVAQSVFSHTGPELITRALNNFRLALTENGLIAVTFVEGKSDFRGEGWVYPGCVRYRRNTIGEFAQKASLYCVRIPWYHREQTWYLLAKDRDRLPTKPMMQYLRGAVLYGNELSDSWQRDTIKFKVTSQARRLLPRWIKQSIKSVINRNA